MAEYPVEQSIDIDYLGVSINVPKSNPLYGLFLNALIDEQWNVVVTEMYYYAERHLTSVENSNEWDRRIQSCLRAMKNRIAICDRRKAKQLKPPRQKESWEQATRRLSQDHYRKIFRVQDLWGQWVEVVGANHRKKDQARREAV